MNDTVYRNATYMEDKELEGYVDDRTARYMARATYSSSAPASEVAAGTMISGIAVDLDAPCYRATMIPHIPRRSVLRTERCI